MLAALTKWSGVTTPSSELYVAEAERSWRIVSDHNLQTTHCVESPTWTGRWFAPSGDRWWRDWSCPEHPDGQTRLRESGRRSSS